MQQGPPPPHNAGPQYQMQHPQQMQMWQQQQMSQPNSYPNQASWQQPRQQQQQQQQQQQMGIFRQPQQGQSTGAPPYTPDRGAPNSGWHNQQTSHQLPNQGQNRSSGASHISPSSNRLNISSGSQKGLNSSKADGSSVHSSQQQSMHPQWQSQQQPGWHPQQQQWNPHNGGPMMMPHYPHQQGVPNPQMGPGGPPQHNTGAMMMGPQGGQSPNQGGMAPQHMMPGQRPPAPHPHRSNGTTSMGSKMWGQNGASSSISQNAPDSMMNGGRLRYSSSGAPQGDIMCQPTKVDDMMHMEMSGSSMGHSSDKDRFNKDKARGSYRCGRCGVPKKGHVCPYQPKLKRRPDDAVPEMKNSSTQVEMDEYMILRRLNLEIQGFPESYAASPDGQEDMVGAEPATQNLGPMPLHSVSTADVSTVMLNDMDRNPKVARC